MRKFTTQSLLVCLSVLFSLQAFADKPNNTGKPNQAKHNMKAEKHNPQTGASNPQQAILQHAGINSKDAKHLAKKHHANGNKPLPPGIRKNIARGKTIPPGIAMTRLSSGYLNQLPHYPNHEWRGYGTDLVLVDKLSNKIADVLIDALD